MSNRSGSLDQIRAFAILPVIVHHYHSDWVPGGGSGVGLFFALSGFLIGNLLSEHDSSEELAQFMIRRVFRVYPMFLLSMLIIWVCTGSMYPERITALTAALPGLLTMVTLPGDGMQFGYGVGVLWSLQVEIAFYTSAAAFCMAIGWERGLWSLVAMLVLSAVYLSFDGQGAVLGAPLFYWGGTLAMGVALSLVMKSRIPTASIKSRRLTVTVAIFVYAFMLFSPPSWANWHTKLLVSAACCCAVIWSGDAVRIIPTLPFIGRISYSMYLVHALVIAYGYQLFNMNINGDTTRYLSYVVSLSTFTYLTIETPFIAIGSRLAGLIKSYPRMVTPHQ